MALQRLISWFNERVEGGVIIAFSGGVDSTLVAAAAHKAAPGSALAITVETEFMTKREIREAVMAAKALGINHEVIRLKLPRAMISNPSDRCYRCKGLMMRSLNEYAEKHGQSLIVDGTNNDDIGSGRPGLKAIKEEGIASPLAELGFGKLEVRAMSKLLGLDHGKPSSPCLATRFQTGHHITEAELEMVEKAEEFVRAMGFSQVRVRVRGGLAKIEVGKSEIRRMMAGGRHSRVASRLKRLGFEEVALDLEGYEPEAGTGNSVRKGFNNKKGKGGLDPS
jgi:uncharacterized protein